MAIAATTIFHDRTDGDDTFGGGFNPGNANMLTDLAATVATSNAPVCTSASYTFVAGDVGKYLFIKSGTDWTPGWYVISSVAGGAATIQATVGTATLYKSGIPYFSTLNTVAGCATVASPTSGTFAIDYSRGTAATLNLTDGACAGAGTTFTSATGGFTAAMRGNVFRINSGTNTTAGLYEIVNTASGTSITIDRTCDSGGGASAVNFKVGGSGLSPALHCATLVAGNTLLIRGGDDPTANPFLLSNSSNVAGGRLTLSVACQVVGYGTIPGDITTIGSAARPVLKANANSVVCITGSTGNTDVFNLVLDGDKTTRTGTTCVSSTSACVLYNVSGNNGASNGLNTSGATLVGCSANNNGGFGVIYRAAFFCVAKNGAVGYQNGGTWNVAVGCVAHSNTASGFNSVFGQGILVGCLAANNGTSGVIPSSSGSVTTIANCVFLNNTQYGINNTGAGNVIALNNAYYGNASGETTGNLTSIGGVTLSGDPFTASASDDYTLASNAAATQLTSAGLATLGDGTSAGYIDIGHYQTRYGLGSAGGADIIGG